MTVFDHIIGHERLVDLLEAEASRPTHAYLFVGPTGVGKATVAKSFAALLLAGGRDPDSVLARIERNNHPDLTTIVPQGRTMLGVDQARATVSAAMRTPVEADRKVFLFEEAGAMSEAAANALLKTIEEPTASTVFVLVVEAEDELPDTIASRSRTLVFGRVPDDVIRGALVARGVESSRAEEAARIASGRPGLALALATSPNVAEYRRRWLEVPTRVTASPGEAFQLADEVLAAAEPLVAEIDDEKAAHRAKQSLLVTGLEILAGWYTDAAAAQFGAPQRNHDIPVHDLVQVQPRDAVARAEQVLDAVMAVKENQRPQLVLANLFAGLGS